MSSPQPIPPDTPEPILLLEKSLIRSYCPSDAEPIAKEANNLKIAKWMLNRFPHPYTLDAAQGWIKTATSASPMLDFAICRREDNTVIGSIGAKRLEDVNYRTMIVGYWLGEEHWGKGIATEALIAFSRWILQTFDHVIRLEAFVYQGNEASARVLEKAGYQFESRSRRAVEKFGVVLDSTTYCMFRRRPL